MSMALFYCNRQLNYDPSLTLIRFWMYIEPPSLKEPPGSLTACISKKRKKETAPIAKAIMALLEHSFVIRCCTTSLHSYTLVHCSSDEGKKQLV